MRSLKPKLLFSYLLKVLPQVTSLGLLRFKSGNNYSVNCFQIAGLAALVTLLQGGSAFAASFRWDGRQIPNETTPREYLINGVTVRFDMARTGTFDSVSFPTFPNPSALGFPDAAGPLGTFSVNIDNAPGLTGTLGLLTRFRNDAQQLVPVDNLRYRIVDIDRDAVPGQEGDPAVATWQDQVGTFAFLSGSNVPVTPTILDLNGTVQQVNAGINLQVPPLPGIAAGLPGTAVFFNGIDDQNLLTAAVLTNPTGDLAQINIAGTDGPDPGGPEREAFNRSQEGSVVIRRNAASDQFVVLYGDGNNFNNGGNPTNHGVGMLGDFDFDPGIIGVRKQVTQLTNNGDGSFTATYQVGVTNLGQTALSNVALDDNIRRANTGNYVDSFGTFGTDATNVTIIPGSLQLAAGSGPLTLNNGFDGGASGPGAQLLGGGNTLAVNETKTLTYQVRFTPNAGVNQFDSQVVASGTTPGGGITRDRSNDGTTFDSSGSVGDPTSAGAPGSDRLSGAADFNNSGIAVSPGQGDDTVTSFQVAAIAGQPPIIGVTKQVVGSPIDLGGGNYRVRYRQVVRNLGTVPLSNVNLSENLVQTYRRGQPNGVTSFQVDPASITAVGAAPAGFPAGFIPFNGAANPGFNGEANQTIAGGATLGIGQYSIVDFDVIVQPGANLGDGPNDPPYDGQVIATGVGGTGTLANTLTTDLSNDATNVAIPQQLPQDVTGNGTANTGLVNGNLVEGAVGGPENTPTSVVFTPAPQIGLTKQVVSVEPDPTVPGSFLVRFRYVVQNLGPVELNGVNICDNLSTQFNGVNNFEVVGRGPGTNFTVNPVFTGVGSLLNNTDPNYNSAYLTGCQGNSGALSLGTVPGTLTAASPGVPGESATTDILVRVAPGANLGPYVNNALTFGTGNNAAAQLVTDLSDDTPNPTGGNPAFIGRFGTPAFTGASPELVDTFTPVLFPTPVALFKTITNLTPSVSGVNLTGPAPILGAPATVTGATLVNGLGSGTVIQYTLWAFNNSGVAVNNYRICDILPQEVEYVSGGTLVRVPTLSPISDPACGPNALDRGSGYVIFDVGTLPPSGSTFVNLRVRLRN